MAKVIATQRGYFGGEIREAGKTFVIPDELWEDEKRRPSWCVPAAFGGKGDHDGDGRPGGTKPAKPGKGKGKAETVEAPTAEPFADAPAPETASNGVVEALGGAQPDWIAPGAADDKPVMADD